jgi:hypothetical protein
MSAWFLALLTRPLRRLSRKPGSAADRWKLLRDEPADWKDAVYSPKALRRKRS